MHFRIKDKREKIRFVPVHPMALRLIGEYLEAMPEHCGGRKKEISVLPSSVRSRTTAQEHSISISTPVPSTATL
jgi:site-specific recombinase XerD